MSPHSNHNEQINISSSNLSDIRVQFKEKLQPLLVDYPHLDLSDQEYSDKVLITGGGFGDVYHAYTSINGNRTGVAMKQLRAMLLTKDISASVKAFSKEIIVWSRLKHANVVEFMGYSFDEHNNPTLVSKWMDKGTVLSYVKQNPQVDIHLLVQGIAKGLEYIHRSNVVHSDMKSDNVLISDEGTPQICDFGLSRIVAASSEQRTTDSGKPWGSTRWMSPEYLKDGPLQYKHTKETDIWAFEMTVYEILTLELPFHDKREDVVVMNAIMNGEKPKKPDMNDSFPASTKALWKLCTICWSDNPADRWPMARIVDYLSGEPTTQSIEDSQSSPGAIAPPIGEIERQYPRTPSIPDIQANIQVSTEREQINHQRNSERPTTGSAEDGHRLSQEEAAAQYGRIAKHKMNNGEWKEAADAFGVVIQIFQQLAREIPPVTDTFTLAKAYRDQSFCLEKFEQDKSALKAAKRALVQWTILSNMNSAWLPRLGSSYRTVGRLSRNCDPDHGLEDAIYYMEEAISTWKIVVSNESNFHYRPKLAQAYYDYGDMLEENGEVESAIDATGDAIIIWEEMLESQHVNPDVQILIGLVDSYYKSSTQLQKTSYTYIHEAIEDSKSGVRIGRKLANKDPVYLPRIERAYALLSNQLEQTGQYRAAIATRREYEQIRASITTGNSAHTCPQAPDKTLDELNSKHDGSEYILHHEAGTGTGTGIVLSSCTTKAYMLSSGN